MTSDQVQRIYLDELGDPSQQSVRIGLMQLTIAPEETAAAQARGLIERAQREVSSTVAVDTIIEVITTIAVYKFTNLSIRDAQPAFVGEACVSERHG